eukprot:1854638-Ditylum_brightwellii.AAC.1
MSNVNNIYKGWVVPKGYYTPPIDVIDDEKSVQIKEKIFIAIKEWDDPHTNVHERDLKFPNKPGFVKFISFNYQFRKAVMEHIIKPVPRKCLPSVGAGADTVTALLTCVVLNYNMYKNHSQ